MRQQESSSIIAANIQRLMKARGLNPSRLAKEAGMSRGYVRDIINGKLRVPGVEAVTAIAEVLRCSVEELTREYRPEDRSAQNQRDRARRRRALDIAERAMGEDGDEEHAALVFRAAEMLYGLIMEREALGPLDDDDEVFWRTIDSMARAWMADRR